MPPWSCVHSCTISVAWSPTYDAAALTLSEASVASSCTARAATSVTPWLASNHIFMSAKRCLIAWYDASGRPNEVRSARYSSVSSTTRSSAPTVSAHCSTTASCSWRSTVAAAPSTSPTTSAAGTRAPSKRTVANRRGRGREGGGHGGPGEGGGCEPAEEVDGGERLDRPAGGGPREQQLGEPSTAAAGDEQ